MVKVDANWTVITGSTGGIGSEITKILASRGNNLILVNRSQGSSQSQRAELLAEYPHLKIETFVADFMDTVQITSAIDQINALPGGIDVLYNNAGILTSELILSAQGYESQLCDVSA